MSKPFDVSFSTPADPNFWLHYASTKTEAQAFAAARRMAKSRRVLHAAIVHEDGRTIADTRTGDVSWLFEKRATMTGKKNPRVKTADAFGNRWSIAAHNMQGALVHIAKGARKTSWAFTNNPGRAKLFVTKGEAQRYAADYVKPYLDKRMGEIQFVPHKYGPTRGEVMDMTGDKNPRDKKTVSEMYVEGIKEARDELKMLRSAHPDLTDAEIIKRHAADNVRVNERLMAKAKPGSPEYDFNEGQRDFWEGKRVLTVRGKINPKFGKRKATPAKPRKSAPKKRVAFGKRKTPPASGVYVVRAVTEKGVKFFWNGLAFEDNKGRAARYADHKQAERVLETLENRLPKGVVADVVTL